MPALLTAFFAPSVAAVQFALKTLLGGGLALWCAMRFGLEQPQWALMTVFIVAQPLSGMVVQKGLARLLGTVVGTVMAVVFMALFGQAPELFLLVLALWLGLCTAASTLLRSAWAYAFVLAGYTVAIIGLPAIAAPLTVFDQAVARCSEISLGILCATLVSALLWPQRVERQLVGQAQQAWQAGRQAARLAILGEAEARQGLLEVMGRIVAVDAQREHAWFEGARGRQRAVAVRVLSRDLLNMLRLARGAARQWQLLDTTEAEALRPWREILLHALDAEASVDLSGLAARLAEAAAEPARVGVQQVYLERLALLAQRVAQAEQSVQALAAGQAPRRAPPALSWHRDWQSAAVYGLRSALAFGVLAVFWVATGWPAASGALLLAAVVCSLFASRDNAPQIGVMFLQGIAVALPVAFIAGQVLLPQVSGFVMLCLVLGVPLFFGALGMASPATGASATSFCLHFIVLCAPQNSMRYDVALFLNEALAIVIGVGCAVLAFRLVLLRSPSWHGRRVLHAIRRDLARLTRQSLGGAENWFGGRMADRLLLLARHYPVAPGGTASRWDDGLLSLDLGDELLHLRACLAAGDAPLGVAEQRFMARLEQLVRAPAGAAQATALDEVAAQLQQALEQAPPSIDRRLALAALAHVQRGWQQWCALHEGEPNGIA
ncbi:Uncharacterized membrane protein YccC [Pseudomonas cuatrocienegasensis]|uniref:Uncharacterized membrane protein YccC n=1 Tax=Pseudomonas cuatrocienegasensis TaxID=543360 RepID=A0ABY1B4S5_9PSED|nr:MULTISPECIES: FUSC family protein [Pseudomonas]OEC37283.1 fusaric acid resistance protein [Pseudomonas sp. 21C1]SEP91698.1 Uncharacterized membrane protein YccC [Pseudomonas cuatrocienegasensis]